MPKINLPKDMLQKDSFKSLAAKHKEEYFKNLLKKILELNPEGITISQIKDATGMNYSSIWHHLEVLCCTGQGHKISRGNLDIYFHQGKTTHLNDYDAGKARFTLSTLENNEGNFVCIHESRENRLGNRTICRGIIMPVELIDGFIKEISKIKDMKK